MRIKQFFKGGTWRLWTFIGILRAIVFVVLEFTGLVWLRPIWLMEQVLFPDVWLAYRHGLDAGLWFLAVLVADTVVVGYGLVSVAQYIRRRRHKSAA